MLSEIETSLYGAINPASLAETAIDLLDFEVSDKAIPEHHPDGIRFPLLGIPEGMTADLQVTKNRSNEDVLALNVKFDVPRTPYLVEGAVRFAPELHVQCWTDAAGDLKHFSIMTNLGVSGESLRYGISPFEGTIPEGLRYYMRLEEGFMPWVKSFGLKDSSPTVWEVPGQIEGGHLSPELARAVSQRFLEVYSDIRGEGR